MHRPYRIALRLLATLAALVAQRAVAGQLSEPTGKPILTISGEVTEVNRGKTAVFDRGMLEGLGMVKVRTTTPWYKGAVDFEGVPFDKLMTLVGARGGHLVAYALNDYMTDIPIDDLVKNHAILALKRDGNYMPVSDKGPLFIVYPYDSSKELQTQTYYGRSAWQVAKLVIKP